MLERNPCRKDRVNLSLMRSTDLPDCKDIKMPGPTGIREEIQIQLRTQAYLDAVDEYLHQKTVTEEV